jgi:hypothetical protein
MLGVESEHRKGVICCEEDGNLPEHESESDRHPTFIGLSEQNIEAQNTIVSIKYCMASNP